MRQAVGGAIVCIRIVLRKIFKPHCLLRQSEKKTTSHDTGRMLYLELPAMTGAS